MADASPAVVAAFSRKYDGWDVTDDTVDGERVIMEIHVARWLLGR